MPRLPVSMLPLRRLLRIEGASFGTHGGRADLRRFQGRWFVVMLALGVGLGLAHLALAALGRDPSLGALSTVWLGVCGWFAAALRRAGVDLRRRARGYLLATAAALFAFSTMDGGALGSAAIATVLLPASALVFLGRRAAQWYAVGVVAHMLVVALLDPPLGAAFSAVPGSYWPWVRALHLSGVMLLLVALAVFALEIQQHHVQAAHRANEELRRTTEALSEALARAEAANRAKTAFLANISHEVRTPLNAIVGMTEATRDQLDGPNADALGLVLESSHALLRLVDDLLDLSRLEAGRMALNEGVLDLRVSIEQVVRAFVGPARQRGQQLVLDVDEDALVLGDDNRLRQVVAIFLSNAVKHAEPGVVRVNALRLASGHLRVEITDEGPGLEEDLHERIFEAFEQAEGGNHRSAQGPGLGLTMARALCHVMGGRVGVGSQPGVGSCFWFELPLPVQASPGLPRFASRVALALPEAHPFRRPLARQLMLLGCEVVEPGEVPHLVVRPAVSDQHLEVRAVGGAGAGRLLELPYERRDVVEVLQAFEHAPVGVRSGISQEPTPQLDLDGPVLVVEDNEVNRIVARRMLEGMGCVVHTAQDGYEAIERVQHGHHYSIVFMDIQMPGIDGYEATRRIRALEGRGDRTPIVALTANALPEHRDASLGAGMDDHVAKPIRRDVLVAALTRWAGARPSVVGRGPVSALF